MHNGFNGRSQESSFEIKGLFFKYLANTINHSLKESTFPGELKQSQVISVYKKIDPLQKENCRPVSLLPLISEVFDIAICKKINKFMENKISK